MHSSPDPLKKLGYDPENIQLKPLIAGMMGMFALCVMAAVVCLVAIYLLVPGVFDQQTADAAKVHLTPKDAPIQADAHKDIHEFRKQESLRTDHYGWADKEKNVARIPVDEALAQVAREGLNARGEAVHPAQSSVGTPWRAESGAQNQINPESHITDSTLIYPKGASDHPTPEGSHESQGGGHE